MCSLNEDGRLQNLRVEWIIIKVESRLDDVQLNLRLARDAVLASCTGAFRGKSSDPAGVSIGLNNGRLVEDVIPWNEGGTVNTERPEALQKLVLGESRIVRTARLLVEGQHLRQGAGARVREKPLVLPLELVEDLSHDKHLVVLVVDDKAHRLDVEEQGDGHTIGSNRVGRRRVVRAAKDILGD